MLGITIAIDGFSACGKSTLAKQVAKHYGYIFIDSGAMYRAVTLFALQNGLIENGELNSSRLIDKLNDVKLRFEEKEGYSRVFLNEVDVEDEIRQGEVPNNVSKVATIKEVREKLVEEQRNMASSGGIVMDGRDIGTVVFPDAELKIFVTASKEVRVMRRWKELMDKGIQADIKEVERNLLERDLIDSTRLESPLRKAEDAVVLDNSEMTRQEQLQWVISRVEDVLVSKNLS
jgi:cytidylate kinase